MHLFYLSILLLLLLSGFALGQNTPPPSNNYTCTVHIFLSCGTPEKSQTSYVGREWVSDTGSEFVPRDSHDISLPSTPNNMDPSASNIPYYNNSRIFLSNFTYSFPVSAASPMFLRLHFYPETYSGHDKSTSFFSVVANDHTLMSNFSAFLALTPNREYYFSKEFIVSSGDDGELKLTFIPNPGSYAFVNAIEVVSMPADLYYNRDYKNISLLEFDDGQSMMLRKENSLENMYRLNVGAADLAAESDRCMFRRWLRDLEFVSQSQLGVELVPPLNLSIEYIDKDNPPYMAPEAVYKTSRIMGGPGKENLLYNLSWSFPVDPGFSYLVRLHFCEIQPEITAKGQRLFDIYLDGQTAQESADVLEMSGAHGVPVHRDYVVFVSRTDLVLALHPHTSPGEEAIFLDATLNGLEMFKISRSDRGLAGFNPDRPPGIPAPPSARPPSGSNQNRIALFAGVCSGVVGFLVLSVLCFLIFRRRVLRHRNSGYKEGAMWDPFSTSTNTKSTKSRGSSLPSDLCRHFTLAEIKAATNNFDQVFLIGAGGFGNVYKGTIDTGPTHVAIKRLNQGSKQGLHEFLTEIELLSRLRHLHLVSLIGFCEDDNEMILVYDYMSHGTLRDHLYNTQNPPLNWTQRLQICIGAARGLQHLHTGANHTIIHRDVKTTNILLDEKWVAKVSDFGLSRIGSTSVSKAHVTTVVKGSFGYLDPEYFKRQHLTEKSDVYSFGVVLCEVICAKPPLVNLTGEKRRVSLAEWARECYRRGTFESLVDAKLKGKIAAESLNKYIEIAMKCLGENGSERPSMGDVVWGLEFVLELQKTADKRTRGEEEVESDDLWDESVTASTEVTTVVGSSISGERVSMD